MKQIPLSSLHWKTWLASIRLYERMVASAVVLITIAFLSYLFLLPTMVKSQEILRQQSLLSERLNRLKQKNALLSSVDDSQYRTVIDRAEQIIPQSKDFVSLFSTLDILEIQTGVSVRGTDFQLGLVSTRSAQLVKTHPSGAFPIPLHLTIVAQPSQMLQFLDRLSRIAQRMITIDDVQWSFQEDGSVKAVYAGQAYFLPVSGSIGALDSALLPLTLRQKELFELLRKLPPTTIETQSDVSVPTGKENLFE